MLRPGNFIQAKAYAAITATVIGMTTLGMVITIEFTKYVEKLVSLPVSTSL